MLDEISRTEMFMVEVNILTWKPNCTVRSRYNARQLSLWLLYEMCAEPKIDTDVVIKQAASRDFPSLYIPHMGLPD